MALRRKNREDPDLEAAGGGPPTATAEADAGGSVGMGATGGPPVADEAVAAEAAGGSAATAVAEADPSQGDAEAGADDQARARAQETADQARERAAQTAQQAQESAQQAAAQAEEQFEQRPEIFVGAAFLGGFLLAKVIGALGGDDD